MAGRSVEVKIDVRGARTLTLDSNNGLEELVKNNPRAAIEILGDPRSGEVLQDTGLCEAKLLKFLCEGRRYDAQEKVIFEPYQSQLVSGFFSKIKDMARILAVCDANGNDVIDWEDFKDSPQARAQLNKLIYQLEEDSPDLFNFNSDRSKKIFKSAVEYQNFMFDVAELTAQNRQTPPKLKLGGTRFMEILGGLLKADKRLDDINLIGSNYANYQKTNLPKVMLQLANTMIVDVAKPLMTSARAFYKICLRELR